MNSELPFKEVSVGYTTTTSQDEESVVKESPANPGAEPTTLLGRYINLPSVINFELCTQAAWETIAITFQFSLLNGGPASMVYGGIIAGFGASAVAISLAEMASMDPAVGAQYRWSANFAPAAPRFWGLIQGWLTVAAWIFTTAAGPASLANIVEALIIFNNDSYVPERWHVALLMWFFILVPFVLNLWLRKVLNALESLGGIIHVIFFIVNIIVLSVLARRSTTDFVFKTLTHDISGWTNPGVAFGLGLLTMTFPLGGADGILHMADEIKSVRTRMPISIISATVSNAILQFAFTICLLFTIGDVDAVTNTTTGLPIVEVYYLATGSKAASTFLVVMMFIVVLVGTSNSFASVTRLTWSFARDKGLPFSSFFSQLHPKFHIPFNSLALISFICFILSLIYIGSSTAYNAIISLSAMGLHISYFFPIFFFSLRKIRGPRLAFGPFSLPRWGLPINLFALSYLIFVIIWMPFPAVRPVTGETMNYAGPLFGAIVLGALLDWFISGRKRFQIPVARRIAED
ncbi:amino acid transporter [Microthyrium microscopicum]|uniref:Amino acid transporter n=1 Tax=Microthyrium microscopicum TaxID=703497 RepID=A0A6A6UNG6_9PEZI|nr:amino acid transporter [Microthyrium microscopicum]